MTQEKDTELTKDILDEINEDALKENILDQIEDKKKEEERKRKGDALWTAVQLGDDKNITLKVANILNRYPDTRNSDIELQIRYWQTYEGVTGDRIGLKRMTKLTKLTSISRARATIQNEYKLFVADEEVRKRRKALGDEEKEIQILNKPVYSKINIFADETGKDENYVIVGGVWLLDEQLMAKIMRDSINWSNQKSKQGIKVPEEFHFKKLNNKNVQELALYKEFFDLILENSEMISFKAVAVKKSKLERVKTEDLLNKLYYQFIRLGVQHEIESSRFNLPRSINITKDDDGDSELVIEEMKEKISDKFKLYYEDKLILDELRSMESHKHVFLQFTDLFVAALNRKYNIQSNSLNNKDKLADYILNTLQVKEVMFSANDVGEDNKTEIKYDHAVMFMFN